MLPLECELPGGHRDGFDRPTWTDLGTIESVAASRGLVMHCREVRVDRQARLRMGPEAFQLGMPRVSARFAAQYSLRQQSLAPQGDQALWIEIPGVQ